MEVLILVGLAAALLIMESNAARDRAINAINRTKGNITRKENPK